MLGLIFSIALATSAVSAASLGNNTVDADACTVSSYTEVATAVSSCTTITLKGFTIPAGKSLDLNLKTGTKLTFEGTFKFDYDEWAGPLVTVKGSDVTVTGASGSVLNGQGEKYWDGKGSSGKTKPKFFRIQTTGGSKLSNIKLLNCPVHCVSVGASDTTISGWTLDSSAGDSGGGHNTDGFDISSSKNLVIENSVIKNQDDCVAVNQGSNIKIKGLTCSGGHGLSLSVGQSTSDSSANQLSGVTFSDCTVSSSDNGIHVKTHTDGATGYIKDVTYENIKLSSIRKYGINVQEDYKGGSSTGTAKGNIPITGLTMKTVTGTMSDGMDVYILCGSGGCSSWTWSGVSITGGKKSNSCNFKPSGFTC